MPIGVSATGFVSTPDHIRNGRVPCTTAELRDLLKKTSYGGRIGRVLGGFDRDLILPSTSV